MLFAISFFVLHGNAQSTLPECSVSATNGLDFQIVTDKLVYAPKSMMQVKFVVANTDYTQGRVLYLYRLMNYCTSQMGSYRLTLLDKNNNWVPIRGCSHDVEMNKVDAVETFTNPRTGVALRAGEVFGSVADLELPAKNGTYRLKAEILPGLGDKQRQALAEKEMRILPAGCTISAPIVTITVK